MFQRLGVSEDSNLTSSPAAAEPLPQVEVELVPTTKPKRKSRFEPEPQKQELPKRKDGKWDMFAEDNSGGQYSVSCTSVWCGEQTTLVVNIVLLVSH